MQIARKQLYIKLIILILLSLVILSFICGNISTALASTENVLQFDSTDVLDDLNGMTVDGKAFNINDYPTNPVGNIQAITFVEYCYSQYANVLDNYALYIYLYNPSLKRLETKHILNKVQLAVEFNDKGMPSKYKKFSLMYCSGTSDGLFYKYKIIDRENELLNNIRDYAQNNSGKRCYYVSGVELVNRGSSNVEEYKVGKQYTYEGYADGYGDSNNFPLKMYSLGMESIQTEVHYSFFRPNGESSAGNHTQHQLNSVYFSVPNRLIKKYGVLSAVHMEWYEYLTKEIFVIGNQEVYSKLMSYIGKDVVPYDRNVYYGLSVESSTYDGMKNYNCCGFGTPIDFDVISKIFYLFSTSGKNASDFSITSNDLLDYIKNYNGSGDKINGKYFADLFDDKVTEGRKLGYNDLTVKAEDKLSLTSYKLTQTWFQKLFGIKDYDLTIYNDIDGIVSVSDSDISLSKTELCSKLYIDESNYDEFVNFYNDSKLSNEDCTVFLLRFAVTDYISIPTAVTYGKELDGEYYSRILDRNAYMARQTAFLDLDIIDVTFSDRDGVNTIIPVVANPIDGIGSITPPVNKSDNWFLTLLAMVFGLIILILMIYLLSPIVPYIIQAIIWLIKLPFKGISAIFKGIEKAANKRKRGK